MKIALKSLSYIVLCAVMHGCGVDPASEHLPKAPTRPEPQLGLIQIDLGGCGDANNNSGDLIHVNLGGRNDRCRGWRH